MNQVLKIRKIYPPSAKHIKDNMFYVHSQLQSMIQIYDGCEMVDCINISNNVHMSKNTKMGSYFNARNIHIVGCQISKECDDEYRFIINNQSITELIVLHYKQQQEEQDKYQESILTTQCASYLQSNIVTNTISISEGNTNTNTNINTNSNKNISINMTQYGTINIISTSQQTDVQSIKNTHCKPFHHFLQPQLTNLCLHNDNVVIPSSHNIYQYSIQKRLVNSRIKLQSQLDQTKYNSQYISPNTYSKNHSHKHNCDLYYCQQYVGVVDWRMHNFVYMKELLNCNKVEFNNSNSSSNVYSVYYCQDNELKEMDLRMPTSQRTIQLKNNNQYGQQAMMNPENHQQKSGVHNFTFTKDYLIVAEKYRPDLVIYQHQ